MSTNVTLAGITYPIPAYNDTGWAQGSGNLSSYLIAIASQIATTPAFMQTVAVSASPQTIVSGKTYLTTTTAAAITFNLPQPAINTWFMIKDISGFAQTNNMTLHRFASEKIDGTAADKTLSLANELCITVSDGTDWYVLLEI